MAARHNRTNQGGGRVRAFSAMFLVVVAARQAAGADALVPRPAVVAGSAVPAVASAAHLLPLGPHVRHGLATERASRLVQAFPLAVRRVAERPECGALFRALGSDGVQELTAALYYPPSQLQEHHDCLTGAVALTAVGTPVTRLCQGFASLPLEGAALVLIHEALHEAGLNESPRTPGAMTSSEISRLVKNRCSF